MNEKTVCYVVVALMALAVLVLSGSLAASCNRYGRKCREYDGLVSEHERVTGQLRESSERLEAEQRRTGEAVDGCLRIIRESDGIFSDAGSSVQALRAGLAEIERRYREMEDLLYSVNIGGGAGGGGPDSGPD